MVSTLLGPSYVKARILASSLSMASIEVVVFSDFSTDSEFRSFCIDPPYFACVSGECVLRVEALYRRHLILFLTVII